MTLMTLIRMPEHHKRSYCREIRQSIDDLEDSGYVVRFDFDRNELQVSSNETGALITLEYLPSTGTWIVALHEPKRLFAVSIQRDSSVVAEKLLAFMVEAEEYHVREQLLPEEVTA